jgi:hypothetical protein
MAAFRAKTIHRIIKTNFIQLKGWLVVVKARKKPMKANGMANIV